MPRIAVNRNYKIHILDITELVNLFEHKIEHLLSDYILSHNEINALFDYCIHRAIVNILQIKIGYNGNCLSSGYIDKDIYEDVFMYKVGEYFTAFLYNRLLMFNILVNNARHIQVGHKVLQIQNNQPLVKLTVVGNALWLFEGQQSG